MLKALGFNSLKVQCSQAVGFKYQPAPLHIGRPMTASMMADRAIQAQERPLTAREPADRAPLRTPRGLTEPPQRAPPPSFGGASVGVGVPTRAVGRCKLLSG